MVLLLVLATAGPVGAAPGVWGDYPFLNGIVCPDGVPLVSWPVGPADVAGFATAVPDTASAPPPAGGDLGTVPAGFAALSTADIGALSWLISTYGSAPDPTTVAEVAAAVLHTAGDDAAVSCLGAGGPPASAVQDLLEQAQHQAGPYQVRVTADAATLTVGRPLRVHATVTSAQGFPVAGIPVLFTGPGTAAAPITTDGSGRADATAELTALTPGPVPVTASLAAPVGLRVAQEPGAVPAVVADDPVRVTGQLKVGVDTTAAPSVSVTLDHAIARTGQPVASTVVVRGMTGHSGTVVLRVVGPVPSRDASCRQSGDADFAARSAAHTVSTTTLAITGDVTTPGPGVTVEATGCYSVDAVVTTTDAVPAARARAAFAAGGDLLSVVDPQVSLSVPPVMLPGPLAVHAGRSGDRSASMTVTGSVGGAVAPRNGSCAGGTPPADGASFAGGAPTVSALGCHSVALTAEFDYSGTGTVQVASPAASTLVVRPELAASVGQPDPGQPVTETVTVLGTYRQAGRLTGALFAAAPTESGCAGADWRRAHQVASVAAVATHGDDTYRLSAPARSPGCYSLVPTLRLDANSAVAVGLTAGDPTTQAVSGVALDALDFSVPGARGAGTAVWWVAAGVGAVLLLALCGGTAVLAWRDR